AWVSTRSPWQPCARASCSNGGEGERSARNWPASSPAAPSLNIEGVARRTAPKRPWLNLTATTAIANASASQCHTAGLAGMVAASSEVEKVHTTVPLDIQPE